MIKKLAWNTFKQTGNIGIFMELKQFETSLENAEKNQNNMQNNIQNNLQSNLDSNLQNAVDDFWNKVNK